MASRAYFRDIARRLVRQFGSLLPTAPKAEGGSDLSGACVPVVSVEPMKLSDNRCDYFVQIKVGDRTTTPFVFREEYKARYEAAHLHWILFGGDEPDLLAYSETGWPAAPTPPETAGEYGGPPPGYHPLPFNAVCKCPKMWTDAKGNHWCCIPCKIAFRIRMDAAIDALTRAPKGD